MIRKLTAESVRAGHPDKLCDFISDSVLDACLTVDPAAHVACEVMAANDNIIVAGEISCEKEVDIKSVATDALKKVGYDTQTTYTVVKGDTLWGIAAKFLGNGKRYPEIKALNGLIDDTIVSGQVLKIPKK